MGSVTRGARRAPAQREAMTEQVTAAVERLLAEGERYTALGVQRIADEAGIARSTFYLYFPDKAALLMRVTEAATAELFAAAERWLEDAFGDRAALEAALRDVIRQRRAHGALLGAVAEVAAYDAEVAAFWEGRVNGFAERLRARLTGDAAATTAAFVVWGTERVITLHVERRPAREDARLARSVAATVWAALGRR